MRKQSTLLICTWAAALLAIFPPSQSVADETTLVFQQGAEVTRNGQSTGEVYSDTQDTILLFDNRHRVADQWGPTSESITADWSTITKNRDEQGLVRFDDIVGTESFQIPPGATIVSAKLTLTARNESPSSVNIHRVLIDWSEATTKWTNFGNGNKTGVDIDGTEASEEFVTAPGKTFTADITKFVQDWSNGEKNFGLALIHTATTRDGVDWWSSEAGDGASQPNVPVRPKLEVIFTAVSEAKR